jgi:hypothetical protein
MTILNVPRTGLSRRLAVLLIAICAGAPIMHAEDKVCDATSLKGAFGYKLSGFAYDARGNMYILGAAGRMVSPGDGNLSGAYTYSFDGTVVKQQYTGTYTVAEDCTGSMTLTSGSTVMHFDFVIVNNGLEAELVQTDPGYSLTGTLKHQSPPQAQPATQTTTPAQ